DRRPLARHLPRVRKIELEAHVETERPRQLQRPLQQRRSRPIVAPPERAPARVGKTRARPLGEFRVGLSELGPVAGRLLQVKAEGLPPEARLTFSRRSCVRLSGISSATSASGSGSSRSATGHSGRRSGNSGRARQRTRIGATVESRATCSTKSRKVSSPHW